MAVYVDTSALIKRYVREPSSARLERFLSAEEHDLVISPLGLTEFESMLQRRLRQHDFDREFLERTRDLLARDIESAVWTIQPFDPNVLPHATRLLRELSAPLAMLDAVHLGVRAGFRMRQRGDRGSTVRSRDQALRHRCPRLFGLRPHA